jgi:flagellar basal body-associated protein FliL
MTAAIRRALLTAAAFSALVGAAVLPAPAFAAEGGAPKTAEFVPLGDFTVNVPVPSRRREYLVLSVTLEAPAGHADGLKDIAPRLQDAVLRQLIAMSEQGALRPDQTDPLAIKDALFETINKVQPDGVKDVLITRILFS